MELLCLHFIVRPGHGWWIFSSQAFSSSGYFVVERRLCRLFYIFGFSFFFQLKDNSPKPNARRKHDVRLERSKMTRTRSPTESNHQGNKHIKRILKINSIVFCSRFEVFLLESDPNQNIYAKRGAIYSNQEVFPTMTLNHLTIVGRSRIQILPWVMRNQRKMSLPANFLFQLIRCILSLASVDDHERFFLLLFLSSSLVSRKFSWFGDSVKINSSRPSSQLKTVHDIESASTESPHSRRLDSLAKCDHKPALMIVFLRLISFRVRWCLSGRYDATIQLIN